jgi:hypothetical protein
MQHLGAVGTPAAIQQHLEFHQAHVWAVDSR